MKKERCALHYEIFLNIMEYSYSKNKCVSRDGGKNGLKIQLGK